LPTLGQPLIHQFPQRIASTFLSFCDHRSPGLPGLRKAVQPDVRAGTPEHLMLFSSLCHQLSW
jgi:hypothetical protein